MINALNTTRHLRPVLTATAAVAAIVGLSACGGSTSQADADELLEAVAADTLEVVQTPGVSTVTTPAQPVVEQAVETAEVVALPDTDQVIPASGAELPCAEYYEATELPLHPCAAGQLVADFQNWAAYVSMDVDVDGYFGEATYDAVIDFQRRFGLIETGIIDQVLMDTLFDNLTHPEPWDEEGDVDGDVADSDEVVYLDVEAAIDEALTIVTVEECITWQDELHLGTPELTDDQLWACDVLDIRLTSGD